MSWHSRLQEWLTFGCDRDMRIGERSPKWIDGFRKDLEQWGLPIEIYWENPVMVKGKVECFLRKIDNQNKD